MKSFLWSVVAAISMITLSGCYERALISDEPIDPALLGTWKGPSPITIGSEPPSILTLTLEKKDANTYNLTSTSGLVATAHIASLGDKKFLCIRYDSLSKTNPWGVYAYKVKNADFKRMRLKAECQISAINSKKITVSGNRPGSLDASIEAHMNDRDFLGPWMVTYKKL